MFVKTSWSTYKGKRSVQYHVVESYRDPNTGKPRHRPIINITPLPMHVIDSIREALRTGKTIAQTPVRVRTGDAVRGAGLLAAYRAWKQANLDNVLSFLTSAERQSTMTMVLQRILSPGSKLSLRQRFVDTIFAKVFSQKRFDENELYEVMDILHKNFYRIQQRLANERQTSPVLCLYDITSTYFEGTEAENGEYGHSRDKRWDRYQIIIGLVCDEKGLPVAVEVWPGDTADKSTVVDRVKALRERFGIQKAVFVGDGGMYSETNIEQLEAHGFDYILHVDWRTQRKQLEQLTSEQLGLFDEIGVIEWEENGVRYIGCVSKAKSARAAHRREKGMDRANKELKKLAFTAAKGGYYSWTRLRQKVNELLEAYGVAGLWQIEISYAGEDPGSPEKKTRLQLVFSPDEEAVARRKKLEGRYVLRTSLAVGACSPQQVDANYRSLQKAERAFRHIKSYLRIRPIYHHRERRIRAHVLICFLAYYLVKTMELELRAKGVGQEIELLLAHWDQLKLVEHWVEAGDHYQYEWQWSLGEIGTRIQKEIKNVGWWRSIDKYRSSLIKTILQNG